MNKDKLTEALEYFKRNTDVVNVMAKIDDNTEHSRVLYKAAKAYNAIQSDLDAAIEGWADFHRVDHEDGNISYESHGGESDNEDNMESDTFIVIDGVRAKEVAILIEASLQLAKRVSEIDWEGMKLHTPCYSGTGKGTDGERAYAEIHNQAIDKIRKAVMGDD